MFIHVISVLKSAETADYRQNFADYPEMKMEKYSMYRPFCEGKINCHC